MLKTPEITKISAEKEKHPTLKKRLFRAAGFAALLAILGPAAVSEYKKMTAPEVRINSAKRITEKVWNEEDLQKFWEEVKSNPVTIE